MKLKLKQWTLGIFILLTAPFVLLVTSLFVFFFKVPIFVYEIVQEWKELENK